MRGSCHCGKIAYRLDAEPTEAIECNCSICRRKGSVLAAFAPDQFHLETSRDEIAVYTLGATSSARPAAARRSRKAPAPTARRWSRSISAAPTSTCRR